MSEILYRIMNVVIIMQSVGIHGGANEGDTRCYDLNGCKAGEPNGVIDGI